MNRLKNAIKALLGKPVVKKEFLPIEHLVDTSNILEGHVALIGGATGGIGRSLVDSFLKSGCRIVAAGSNQVKLKSLESEFNSPNLRTIILDYSNYEDFDKVISLASKYFGSIDIFVSAAGIHTENVSFWTMTPQEFDRVISIDLKANYFLCQSVANHMISNNKKGHILLISSSRGSEPAFSPYGISKSALNSMVHGLSLSLVDKNIIVNAIAPGPTATELIGYHGGEIGSEENRLGRLTMPIEVSNLAKILVSDMGDMLIGDVLHLSGGRGVWDIR